MNAAARATCAPARGSRHGNACSPCGDARVHELVPRRVVLDLVDAMAEAIEDAQLGHLLVRLDAPRDGLAAGELAERVQFVERPLGALTAHGIAERAIGAEDVEVDERGWLVDDLVSAGHAATVAEKKAPADLSAGARLREARCDYLMLAMKAAPFGTPRPVTASQPAAVLIVRPGKSNGMAAFVPSPSGSTTACAGLVGTMSRKALACL